MIKQAFNPFLPLKEYIPDGEAHVFGNRVYLFGSHDKENGETFCMLDYMGWSAPVEDLSDWTCSGSIYSANQDPNYDENKMAYIYAPDVVQGNDGRYYLYYCLAGKSGNGGYHNPISVAVCDTPDGKYEYLGVVRTADGKPLMKYVCFDPAVINDNGTIRLYYGTWYPFDEHRNFLTNNVFNRVESEMFGRTKEEVVKSMKENDGIMGAIHVTLADDMITATSEPMRILPARVKGTEFEQHPFFEGSSIRKVGDTYYFVYSSTKNHELCYATSKYPDKEFHFGGTIVSNGDIGFLGRTDKDRLNHTGTNHGGIEYINGKWYVFYHRLTHQSDYSRQACAEEIRILEDGSIPMVEITSCGLNQVPLKGCGTYPAPICCNLTNGKMRHGSNKKKLYSAPYVGSGNGEQYIRCVSSGTKIGYKYFEFDKCSNISITTRGSGEGYFVISTSLCGAEIGKIQIQPSANWSSWNGSCQELNGKHALFFTYVGKGEVEMLNFTFM